MLTRVEGEDRKRRNGRTKTSKNSKPHKGPKHDRRKEGARSRGGWERLAVKGFKRQKDPTINILAGVKHHMRECED